MLCSACGRKAALTEEYTAFGTHELRSFSHGMCADCLEIKLHSSNKNVAYERIRRRYDSIKRNKTIPYFGHTQRAKLPNAYWSESVRDYAMPRTGPMPIRGVYLTGKSRVGKTRTLVWALERAVMRGLNVGYILYPDLIRGYIDALRGDSGDRGKWITAKLKPTVLLIDDLGKGNLTDAGLEGLWTIVEKRMGENKLTWYTANGPARQIIGSALSESSHYFEPLVARIEESTVKFEAT